MDVVSFVKTCVTTAAECTKLSSKSLMAKTAITKIGPSLVDLIVSVHDDRARKLAEEQELAAHAEEGTPALAEHLENSEIV